MLLKEREEQRNILISETGQEGILGQSGRLLFELTIRSLQLDLEWIAGIGQ